MVEVLMDSLFVGPNCSRLETIGVVEEAWKHFGSRKQFISNLISDQTNHVRLRSCQEVQSDMSINIKTGTWLGFSFLTIA